MPGLVSTSIAEELGRTAEPPTTEAVQRAAEVFAAALGRALGAPIDCGRRRRRRSAGRPVAAGAGAA